MRALVLDVDGVLTDGGVILDAEGRESKRFHARDGVGIALARLAGWRVLFLTARHSAPAARRAAELGVECALGVGRKDAFLERWLEEAGIPWNEAAMVGDDLQDLLAMRRVGWPIAVADAAPEVRHAARHVTRQPGGAGAVRDAVEWLLDQHALRDTVVKAFLDRPEGFRVVPEGSGGER